MEAARLDVWMKMGLAGQRVLVIHHDDLGLTLATNDAYAKLDFTTGSIMMPAPYAPQLREGDLGVHLTLTSEWSYPRLRPLTSGASLRDEQGYFWSRLENAWAHIQTEDAEAEMRAQIDAFYATGLEPTHIDTHMGAVLRPDIADIYHRLALEYRLPCLMPASLDELQSLPVDMRAPLGAILEASPIPKVQMIDSYAAPITGRTAWYESTLRELPAGVYHLRHHAAAPGPETDILPDAEKRLGDFHALRDPGVLHQLESWTLATYREVRDVFRSVYPP